MSAGMDLTQLGKWSDNVISSKGGRLAGFKNSVKIAASDAKNYSTEFDPRKRDKQVGLRLEDAGEYQKLRNSEEIFEVFEYWCDIRGWNGISTEERGYVNNNYLLWRVWLEQVCQYSKAGAEGLLYVPSLTNPVDLAIGCTNGEVAGVVRVCQGSVLDLADRLFPPKTQGWLDIFGFVSGKYRNNDRIWRGIGKYDYYHDMARDGVGIADGFGQVYDTRRLCGILIADKLCDHMTGDEVSVFNSVSECAGSGESVSVSRVLADVRSVLG